MSKGAVAVPEAAVGILDIPTGGRVGKFLENEGGLIGFRPEETKKILNDWYSEGVKKGQQEFEQAEGIADKTFAALSNPMMVGTTIVESIPAMLGGGVAARGALGAARAAGLATTPAVGAAGAQLAARQGAIAGAVGEGAVMAGSSAAAIRNETEDGLLTGNQALHAVGTGALGGLFGFMGGKLAQKLGIGDVDTMLAAGTTAAGQKQAKQAAKSIPRQVVEGAIAEGFLEELPQTVSETILQNLALDKQWDEGLDGAAVMGVLAGGVMGAGAAGLSGIKNRPASQEQAANTPANQADQADQTPAIMQGQAPAIMGEDQPPAEPPSPIPATPPTPDELAELDRVTGSPTPSQELGINPADGPLSKGIAPAIDADGYEQRASTIAQEMAEQQAQRAAQESIQESIHQPPPSSPNVPLSEWTTDALRAQFRNAQASNVRQQLAAELQRRKSETQQSDLFSDQEESLSRSVDPETGEIADVQAARQQAEEAKRAMDAAREELIQASPTALQTGLVQDALTDAPPELTQAYLSLRAQEQQTRQTYEQLRSANGNQTPQTQQAGPQREEAGAAPSTGAIQTQTAGRAEQSGRGSDVQADGLRQLDALQQTQQTTGNASADAWNQQMRAMLQTERANLEAAVQSGLLTETQALDIASRAGQTGNVGDAVRTIIGAIEGAKNASRQTKQPKTIQAKAQAAIGSNQQSEGVQPANAGAGVQTAAAQKQLEAPEGFQALTYNGAPVLVRSADVQGGGQTIQTYSTDGQPAAKVQRAALQLPAPKDGKAALNAINAPKVRATAQLQQQMGAQWDAMTPEQKTALVAEAMPGDRERKTASKAWADMANGTRARLTQVMAQQAAQQAGEKKGSESKSQTSQVPTQTASQDKSSAEKSQVPTQAAPRDAAQQAAQEEIQSTKSGAARKRTEAKKQDSLDGRARSLQQANDADERLRKMRLEIFDAEDAVRAALNQQDVKTQVAEKVAPSSDVRNDAQTTQQETPNESETVRNAQAPMAAAPSEKVEGVEGGWGAEQRTESGSADGNQQDAGTDGAGLPVARSGGSGVARVHSEAAGNERVGRGGRSDVHREGDEKPKKSAKRLTKKQQQEIAAKEAAIGEETRPEVAGIPTSEPAIPAANFTITDDVGLGKGGEVAKFSDNIAAIRVLQTLEAEQRRATPDEQAMLARYVGWGGLANAFPNPQTGEYKKGWEARGKELRALLSDEEYAAARGSTRNAHYTSKTVVEAMWKAVERLGFRGGLALESSMGTGNFLGLKPTNIPAHFIGVEYDSLTSRIARALYPQATVLHSGFQSVPLADNTFDLSIGNPPFGSESLFWPHKNHLNKLSIHNQFFLGSMDALKPGGIQAMVVSRYLMDAQDSTARRMLAEQAELIGAIRLPDTAFAENARTEVVTDIIFLQKRPEPLTSGEALPSWVETGTVPDPLGGEAMRVNQYFIENPANVLGTMDRSGSMAHGADITVHLDNPAELADRLDQAVSTLPQNVMRQNDDVLERAAQRHQDMTDALNLALSGAEIGAIKFNPNGELEMVMERETLEGDTEMITMVLTENTPWSEGYMLDAKGNWYREVDLLDDQGKKVKKKNAAGKDTTYNEKTREIVDVGTLSARSKLGKTGLARLKAAVTLRDLVKRQLELETSNASAEKIEENREKLADQYKNFVKKFGFVNRPSNMSAIGRMPDGALVAALELDYTGEITKDRAKTSGLPVTKDKATPAPILSERVAVPPERIERAATISEALGITLSEFGAVNMQRLAELRNMSEEQVAEELQSGEKPLAYLDPETQAWVQADVYLSGNVMRKLRAAQEAGMEKNIDALEAVQPERWGAENITPMLGASWIPTNVYAQFAEYLSGGKAKVTYSKANNAYGIQIDGATTASKQWSTDKATVEELLSDLLNSQSIVVRTKDKDGKTYIDHEASSLANMKADEIKEEFIDWVFRDGNRREALVDLFNDKFNVRVVRQNDGSHMQFPGKVPDSVISFRRHQVNAIWRGIVDRFVLLDHAVGAGKTFAAIARAMERKRMGLSQKPMIVVPNHLVEQWAADVLRLYPGAKILAATKRDFEMKRRRRLFARIATGDWDMVIVPHSSFKAIGINQKTQQKYLEEDLKLALKALEDAEQDAKQEGFYRKPLSVKQAERTATKLQERLRSLQKKAADKLLTFEQLGVDDLTVDESHEFKNLAYNTRMTNVAGMGNPTGSERANDLYQKIRVLRDRPNTSVAFLSGTPISNSAVEMYTLMRYLAADQLKELGLENFDAWRSQYVEAGTSFEQTESNQLKERARLGSNWLNFRSLMDLYYEFTDPVSLEDIQRQYSEDNNGARFPVPKVKGGKDRQLVNIPPTEAQAQMLDELIAEFEELPNIQDPNERNAQRLRLSDRARKLSLDVRAVDPHHESKEEGGKLAVVSENVKRIYDKYQDDKGTQLIFLDRSVSKSAGDAKKLREYDAIMQESIEAERDGDEEALARAMDKLERFDSNEMEELRAAQQGGWNAYDQIKNNLIEMGIPAAEIRFIGEANTDAQKQELFDAVNGGAVRVLIGSSPKMGAGTNVQKKLVALHHVDVTWKPSDIEQREGRIIRQGNELLAKYGEDFEVEVLAYTTERTIDAKMWDLNSRKLKMVNAIRKYDGSFTMTAEDESAVSMQEIAALASGNPLLLERVTLASEIKKLEMRQRDFTKRMYGAQDEMKRVNRILESFPDAIKTAKDRQEVASKGMKEALKVERKVKIEGKEYAKLTDAWEAAQKAIEAQKEASGKSTFAINVNGKRLTSKAAVDSAIDQSIGDEMFFAMMVGKTDFYQRGGAAKAIGEEMAKLALSKDKSSKQKKLGSVFGIDVFADIMYVNPDRVASSISLVDKDGNTITSEALTDQDLTKESIFDTNTVRSSVSKLFNSAIEVARGKQTKSLEETLYRAQADLPLLQERLKETFSQEGELVEKRTRLESIIRELDSAAIKQKDTENYSFTDGENIEREAANEHIREAIQKIAAKFDTPVTVFNTVEDAALAFGRKLQPNARGVAIGNRIGLFAENIRSLEEAEFVLWHEMLHVGLHRIAPQYGGKYTSLMNRLSLANPKIAEAAKEWAKKHGPAALQRFRKQGMEPMDAAKRMRLLAIEEAIADMAGTNPKINGWTAFVAELQQLLRSLGLERLANWMESATNAEVLQVIGQARQAVQGKPRTEFGAFGPSFEPSYSTLGTMPKVIDVDGVQRPTTNSQGNLIHATPDNSEAQRQFAEAERAYGGRVAYDKAKADGKTKLTYGQWVQVRTPNFLQWFGAWNARENAAVKRQASTFEQAKQQAGEFVGKPLTNLSTGLVATVSKGNLGKMTSASAALKSFDAQAHALAVANADQLFAHALLNESHADKRGEPTIAAVHRYVAPMLVDGKVVAVKLTVKETTGPNEPNPLYSVEALEIEKPALEAPESGIERGIGQNRQPPQAGFSANVQQMLAAVNGEGVSKVVDPDTGEPMVVYHGTGADFAVFEQQSNGDGGFHFGTRQAAHDRMEFKRARGTAGSEFIMPVWLNVRTPLNMSDPGRWDDHYALRKPLLDAGVSVLKVREFFQRVDKHEGDLIDRLGDDEEVLAGVQRFVRNELERLMREAGHDGIFYENAHEGGGAQSYVVFNPTQIKSAIGNNGNFDPENADIRYSFAEKREQQAADFAKDAAQYYTGKGAQIREAIEQIAKGFNAPVQVFGSAQEASKAFGWDIKANARGVAVDGRIGLIAENIGSLTEAEFVLWHEMLHIGLDRIAPQHSAEYEQLMLRLASDNQNISKAAKEWQRKHGPSTHKRLLESMKPEQAMRRVRLLSIEEALADMAGANTEINGLNGLVAGIQKMLRALGLDRLANWMESATDAEALQVIAQTRQALRSDGVLGDFGPSFAYSEARSIADVEAEIAQQTERETASWQESLRQAGMNPKAKEPSMTTPVVLRSMGAKAKRLTLDRGYLRAVLAKHPDVPASVFENLPAMLADPLFIVPHQNGGLRVFVDATTKRGEPIAVGVGIDEKGRIHTVTPLHDHDTGMDRMLRSVLSAKGRIYARNKEALDKARAVTTRTDGPGSREAAAPATIALHRGSVNPAIAASSRVAVDSVVMRDHVVKRIARGEGKYSESETEAERQFKETERAYGQEAYEHAKAAGRTKLGYRQWVQVRTPNFKNWFGDWEAVRAKDALQKMDAINVDGLPLGLGARELREAASEVYDRAAKQGNVLMRDGREVQLTGVGLKKTRFHSAYRRVLDLLGSIREVLGEAHHLQSVEHQKTNPGDSIRAWHYYGAKVTLDGKEHFAKLVVRESINGQIYYDNDLTSIEEISGRAGDATRTKSGAAAVSADDFNLAQWWQSVNPDSVSKVIDPDTGEPMVVYHGTNANAYSAEDFTVFQTRPDSGTGGAYFTSDKAQASTYGERVYGVFVNLRNPLQVDAQGNSWANLPKDAKIAGDAPQAWQEQQRKDAQEVDELMAELSGTDVQENTERQVGLPRSLGQFTEHTDTDGVSKAARKAGFDGVLLNNIRDSKTPRDQTESAVVAVAFNAADIKSATDNNGNFDPENADIRYSIVENREQQAADFAKDAAQYYIGKGDAAAAAQKVLEASNGDRVSTTKALHENGFKGFNWRFIDQAAQAARSVDPVTQKTAAVERHAKKVIAGWKNAPKVIVVSNMQDPRVPEAVRKHDAAQKSQGATGEPEGFFYQGKVYVVASSVHTTADVSRVVMHEALGHYGLRGVFGDALRPALMRMAHMRQAAVTKKARQYGLHGLSKEHAQMATDQQIWDSMSADQKMQAAEEVLATIAQDNPAFGPVRSAIAAIRAWLRDNVPGFANMQISNGEIIREYILPARNWVKNGRAAARPNALPAFQRAYHGTPHHGIEQTGFKLNKMGTGEGAQAYGYGMYFASDRQVAEYYRAMNAGEIRLDGKTLWRGDGHKGQTTTGNEMADQLLRAFDGNMLAALQDAQEFGETDVIEALEQAIGRVERVNAGQLYEVDVPETFELLDYDMPLVRQPTLVREILQNNGLFAKPSMTGRELYDSLGTPQEASERLLAMGIPGLRYLDGNSRDGLQNSHNFVIWDEALLTPEAAGITPMYSRTDQEKAAILQGEPVAILDGSEAPQTGAKAVRDWAIKLFESQGNAAQSQDLGNVIMNHRSVRDSMSHGKMNPFKNAAFAAVKDVIEKGVLVYQARHDFTQSYYISAPVRIKGVDDVVTVLAQDKTEGIRVYIHSVNTKENLLNRRVSGADAEASRHIGSSNSGDRSTVTQPVKEGKAAYAEVADELHRLLTLKREESSTDSDDGPPTNFSRSQAPEVPVMPSQTKLREIKNKALDLVSEMTSHEGDVSWWHKTIGTMRNLAERNSLFKPVYEAAQNFIDDVSWFANDSADRASRWVPRVDSWRDLTKRPVSAEDSKAVSRPLFDGTLLWGRDETGKLTTIEELQQRYENIDTEEKIRLLTRAGKLDMGQLRNWREGKQDALEKNVNERFESTILKAGVVFTDAELQQQFKMNEQQISLYREAREAIDRSIDMTARADMLRTLGDEFSDVRDLVLEAETLQDAFELVSKMLHDEAVSDPESSARLMEKLDAVVTTATKARNLMDQGYAPLMRFGRYTVDVVDKDGKRLYFGMYESKAESNRAFAMMRAEFKEATVTSGTMSEKDWQLMANISPESVEMFGNMLGLSSDGNSEQDAAFQKYIQLTKNNHSALKRLIHRKGVRGYSEDVSRVLASFMYSNARVAATAVNAGKIDKAVQAIPKEQGQLKDIAVGLRNYIQDPNEEGQVIKSFMFAQYLGGSIASAMVNMTQPFAVTLPWLTQFGGIRKATGALSKALKDMSTPGFQYEADLAAALKKAEDDGVVAPQEIHQLMAQARGTGSLKSGDGTRAGNTKAALSNAWERTKVLWGQPFAIAEAFNRRSTYIASYRIAKDRGDPNPDAFARKAVIETQFAYCVDSETECLTLDGWKRRDELKIGDVVVGVDENGKATETPLVAIHKFPGIHSVTEFSNNTRFSMVVTPAHRHIVQHYDSRLKKWSKPAIHTTANLKGSHQLMRIPTSPIARTKDAEDVNFAALLGWIAAEGYYARFRNCKTKRNVRIFQSKTHNPEYVKEIENLLIALGGHYRKFEYPKNHGVVTFTLKKPLSTRVLEAMPDKLLTWGMASSMTVDEMKALVDAFKKGDGSKIKEGGWVINQKEEQNLDVLQAMSVMCCNNATKYPAKDPENGKIASLYLHTYGKRTMVSQLDRQERHTDRPP